MRERIAQIVCVLTLGLVVIFAALFARRHNRLGAVTVENPATPSAVTAAASAPPSVARGRVLFTEEGCALCHSFAGEGNPRLPLDDASRHRSPEELRAWITATGPATNELPASVVRRKTPYRDLPRADLDALVDLLCGRASASAP